MRCVVFVPFWPQKSSGAARLARRWAALFPSLRPSFWKARSLRGAAGLWHSAVEHIFGPTALCQFSNFIGTTNVESHHAPHMTRVPKCMHENGNETPSWPCQHWVPGQACIRTFLHVSAFPHFPAPQGSSAMSSGGPPRAAACPRQPGRPGADTCRPKQIHACHGCGRFSPLSSGDRPNPDKHVSALPRPNLVGANQIHAYPVLGCAPYLIFSHRWVGNARGAPR